MLLILSNFGWWDFESCGSRGRGGVRLTALSATLSACILWLKLRSVSHLLSPEENIERGELSTPTTLCPQIAEEEADLFSKAFLTSAFPAGPFTPDHSSLECTPDKPHSQPNCLPSTPSGEAPHASHTAATNNSEGRHITVRPAEARPPPLPYKLPSSSGPSRSEFRFLPTRPSFLGWVSEPKGDPDRCGGYSDVWKCCIRFCEPSDGHPIEVCF